MEFNELIQKVAFIGVSALGTLTWFFWRRNVEQKSTFEELEKTEKLISIKRDMDATGYTVNELSQLEKDLMSRAKAADAISATYKKEIEFLKAIEPIQTQSEMNQEAGQSLLKSENQLDRIIAALEIFFSSEEKNEFDKTHSAWKKFSQLNAQFAAQRYEGGSIQPLIYASTLESAINSRIGELESELEYMRETAVPYNENSHTKLNTT